MDKSMKFARILVGVGTMLTVVPLGVAILSLISSSGTDIDQILAIGWAWWVTVGLLPLGLGFLVVGLGYLVKLKRKAKAELEAESD